MDELFYILFMAIFIAFFFTMFFSAMLSLMPQTAFKNYVCLAEIYSGTNSSGSSIDFSLPYYDYEIRRNYCNG